MHVHVKIQPIGVTALLGREGENHFSGQRSSRNQKNRVNVEMQARKQVVLTFVKVGGGFLCPPPPLSQSYSQATVQSSCANLTFSVLYHERRDTRVSQTRSERQTRSFVRRRFAVYGIFDSSTNRKCRRRRNVFEQNFLFVAHFVSGKPLCPALHDITMRVSSKKSRSFTLLKFSVLVLTFSVLVSPQLFALHKGAVKKIAPTATKKKSFFVAVGGIFFFTFPLSLLHTLPTMQDRYSW